MFDKYNEWVIENQAWVVPLEEAARSFALMLPGRFSDATNVQSEAVLTGLNLVSLYHNTILGKSISDIKLCVTETAAIQRLKNALAFFGCTQIVIELMANRVFGPGGRWKKHGEVGKWKVVLALELIKAWCRLRLVHHNRGKMLLTLTPVEKADSPLATKQEKLIQHLEKAKELDPQRPFADLALMYAKNGRGRDVHGTFLPKGLHPRERPEFVPPGLQVTSEVLYWLRPVFYVLGRCLCKKKSWAPFFSSLLVDILSRASVGRFKSLSEAQKRELGSRVSGWLFYLFRPPFFNRVTRTPLIKMFNILSYIPIIGWIFGGGFMEFVLYALENHYFYTSNT